MVFIGYKGVGKTSIIEAIKGNKNIKIFGAYKKAYKETFHYNKKRNTISVRLNDTSGEICENEDYKQYIKSYQFFFVSDIQKKNILIN